MTLSALATPASTATSPDASHSRQRPDLAEWQVECGLRRYVETVAAAVGMPTHCVGSEVTDTPTGYIALGIRNPAFPDRDLMLTWTDAGGWSVATEPATPSQTPVVLARMTGDVLPPPWLVARLVDRVRTAHPRDIAMPHAKRPAGDLAARLAAYHRPLWTHTTKEGRTP